MTLQRNRLALLRNTIINNKDMRIKESELPGFGALIGIVLIISAFFVKEDKFMYVLAGIGAIAASFLLIFLNNYTKK